jgi:hypothetical protein
MGHEEFQKWIEETQFECKRSIEDFNMEVEHAMDILADCIPYDDPNYLEHLRQMSEQCVKDCWDPNSELNKICGKHDEMLDEGLIDF